MNIQHGDWIIIKKETLKFISGNPEQKVLYIENTEGNDKRFYRFYVGNSRLSYVYLDEIERKLTEKEVCVVEIINS